ncbi:MAG TPA: cupin domain-containing protein [Rubrobacter sp.]
MGDGRASNLKIPSWGIGGAYSHFEVTTLSGAGRPPHVQHREDEFFYVLAGDYGFPIEGGTIWVGEDLLLYVPKGTLHSHKNAGEGVGRMLVSQTRGPLRALLRGGGQAPGR